MERLTLDPFRPKTDEFMQAHRGQTPPMQLPITARKPVIGPLATEFHTTLHLGGDIEADDIFRHSYSTPQLRRVVPSVRVRGLAWP